MKTMGMPPCLNPIELTENYEMDQKLDYINIQIHVFDFIIIHPIQNLVFLVQCSNFKTLHIKRYFIRQDDTSGMIVRF